ncbi:tetratricopeptide repeat protein [Ectothiorhodospiraceae bacterium WFHF3C12]|nr:tetratricopeptide repeat protein [Ectothiorhodospiraceae bacterium WFHF3C12]
MSLINDMLRDLESRRPAGGKDALSGVNAVGRRRRPRLAAFGIPVVVLALAASAAAIWAAYRPADSGPAPVAASERKAAPHKSAQGAVNATQGAGDAPAGPDRRIDVARVETTEDGAQLVLAGRDRLPFSLRRLDGGAQLRLALAGARLDAHFPDLAGATELVRTVSAMPGQEGLRVDLWLAPDTRAQAYARNDGAVVVLRLVAPPSESGKEGAPGSASRPAGNTASAGEAAESATGSGSASNAEPDAGNGGESGRVSEPGAPEKEEPETATLKPKTEQDVSKPSVTAFRKDRRGEAGASLKRLTERARARLQSGDAAAAVADLREVLRADASAHEARQLLARAYVSGGRIPASVSVLEQGLALAPEHTPFLLQLARLLAGAGQSDAALGVLERREPAQPAAEYYALRGALSQQLGRHAQAASAYRQALDVSPDRGGWWIGLGIALDGQGQGEAALQSYREGLRRGGLKPALQSYAERRVARLRAE